jgi:hypothetical protein
MYPRSAESADDIAVTVRNQAGTTISNASAVATGEQTWTFLFSVTANKAWGSEGYTDPETGYTYTGSVLVFRFQTAAGYSTQTLEGYSRHIPGAGGYEYYVYNLPHMSNDGDVTGDESFTFSVTLNIIDGGSNDDDLDIGLFPEPRSDQMVAGYFGEAFPGDQDTDNDLLTGLDLGS